MKETFSSEKKYLPKEDNRLEMNDNAIEKKKSIIDNEENVREKSEASFIQHQGKYRKAGFSKNIKNDNSLNIIPTKHTLSQLNEENCQNSRKELILVSNNISAQAISPIYSITSTTTYTSQKVKQDNFIINEEENNFNKYQIDQGRVDLMNHVLKKKKDSMAKSLQTEKKEINGDEIKSQSMIIKENSIPTNVESGKDRIDFESKELLNHKFTENIRNQPLEISHYDFSLMTSKSKVRTSPRRENNEENNMFNNPTPESNTVPISIRAGKHSERLNLNEQSQMNVTSRNNVNSSKPSTQIVQPKNVGIKILPHTTIPNEIKDNGDDLTIQMLRSKIIKNDNPVLFKDSLVTNNSTLLHAQKDTNNRNIQKVNLEEIIAKKNAGWRILDIISSSSLKSNSINCPITNENISLIIPTIRKKRGIIRKELYQVPSNSTSFLRSSSLSHNQRVAISDTCFPKRNSSKCQNPKLGKIEEFQLNTWLSPLPENSRELHRTRMELLSSMTNQCPSNSSSCSYRSASKK